MHYVTCFGHLVKVLYWDGQGFCLFTKRLEKGRFVWPISREGVAVLTPAQLAMLSEGVERCPGAPSRCGVGYDGRSDRSASSVVRTPLPRGWHHGRLAG